MKIFNLHILTDTQLYNEYEKIENKKKEDKLKREEEERKEQDRQREWDLWVKRFSEKGYILDMDFDWSGRGGWFYRITNKDNLSASIRKWFKFELEEFLSKV